MKKKVIDPSDCIHSAERVKFLFSKGRDALLKNKPKLGQHHRNIIGFSKAPIALKSLPSNVLREELKKKTRSLSKKPSFKKSNLKFVSGTKNFLKPSIFKSHSSGFLEKKTEDHSNGNPGAELNSKRVKGWSLKEYIVAVRKLNEFQTLIRHHDSSNKHHITLLQEAEQNLSDEKREFDQWQEFIEAKEARYFQIGRVIKFLSD